MAGQVDGALGNLLQGVSQQPNRDRAPGQCSLQLNAVADIVDGLKRRPSSDYIADLVPYVADSVWHNYDTGTEQYVIRFSPGTVDVWDLDGVQQVVNIPTTSYLDNCSTSTLSIATIGDYTIVANNTIVTEMKPTTTISEEGALLHFTSGGENLQLFTVRIDAVTATYTGPGITSTSTTAGLWSVDNAVQNLFDVLSVHAGLAAAGYIFAIQDSTILVTNTIITDVFDVAISDGHPTNSTCWIVQGSVDDVDKLPAYALPGMIVAITGDGTDEKDDFYLGYTTNTGFDSVFGYPGTWREVAKPGEFTQFFYTQMPHALIRQSDGEFYFGPLDGTLQGGDNIEDWEPRSSGNLTNVPEPSFIGKTINFVGTFQDRMYLLSGDSIDFSGTRTYFNFFNESAREVIDSDPVQLRVSESYDALTHAVQHNRHLVLFTSQSQYMIKGNVALTPASANMTKSTSFEFSGTATPSLGGDVIFFPITYGTFSGIREFYTASETDSNTARAITEHVKRYMPGYVVQQLSSASLGLLFVRTSGSPKSVFLYQYLWQQNERVQSAWSEWIFPWDVNYIFWKGTDIYVVFYMNGTQVLAKIDITDIPVGGIDFSTYTDARVVVESTGSIATLPYTASIDELTATRGSDSAYPGMSLVIDSVENIPQGDDFVTIVTFQEAPGGKVIIGKVFTTQYDPPMPKILDYRDRVISTDRLVLSEFIISYKETGGFTTLNVNPYYADSTNAFTGREIGSLYNIIGVQPIATGTFEVAVRRSTEDTVFSILSVRDMPMTLTSIEWKGQYNKRGRRI